MKKMMKTPHFITLALALQGLLGMQPANALQASASIDMDNAIFAVTDLDSTDGIESLMTLSNRNSNVSWSWSTQQSPGGYFTKLVDYSSNPAQGWTTARSVTYTTPLGGAISNAALASNESGATTVTGYDNNYALWGSFSFSADFTLTGNTQVDIWIPVALSVDPAGSDPALPGGIGREAYARTILSLSSLTYESLAWDSLWRDHWTSGDLTGNLHVIFKNEVGADYSGTMDVNGYAVTMSYGSSTTVPEPGTVVMLAIGLFGIAASLKRNTL